MRKITFLIGLFFGLGYFMLSYAQVQNWDYYCTAYDPVKGDYYTAYWNDTGNGECGPTTEAQFCYWGELECSSTGEGPEQPAVAYPGVTPCCGPDGPIS